VAFEARSRIWRFIGGKMLDSVSKVERYRKEAIRCAELAKEASPPFLAEIYRKVAIRYVFMAEELLKGPGTQRRRIRKGRPNDFSTPTRASPPMQPGCRRRNFRYYAATTKSGYAFSR
jgi:hypothetical protein